MVIFNSYVKLPEGKLINVTLWYVGVSENDDQPLEFAVPW